MLRARGVHVVGRLVPSFGTCLAMLVVLCAAGLYVYNNLAPYLALPYSGAMTMFSGLKLPPTNHLFMPYVELTDRDVYVSIVRIRSGGLETPAIRTFRALAAWSAEKEYLLNLDLVRYHANRACGSAPEAEIGLTLALKGGGRQSFENVCAEPSMLHYNLFSSHAKCLPDCPSLHSFIRWLRPPR